MRARIKARFLTFAIERIDRRQRATRRLGGPSANRYDGSVAAQAQFDRIVGHLRENERCERTVSRRAPAPFRGRVSWLAGDLRRKLYKDQVTYRQSLMAIAQLNMANARKSASRTQIWLLSGDW